jgi:hypothetical protein
MIREEVLTSQVQLSAIVVAKDVQATPQHISCVGEAAPNSLRDGADKAYGAWNAADAGVAAHPKTAIVASLVVIPMVIWLAYFALRLQQPIHSVCLRMQSWLTSNIDRLVCSGSGLCRGGSHDLAIKGMGSDGRVGDADAADWSGRR